jgi:hypothetical protein
MPIVSASASRRIVATETAAQMPKKEQRTVPNPDDQDHRDRRDQEGVLERRDVDAAGQAPEAAPSLPRKLGGHAGCFGNRRHPAAGKTLGLT